MFPCALRAAQDAGTASAGAPAIVSLSSADHVTLDLNEADIRNVLRIISLKSGVNIVASAEVKGPVTIRLIDVPWEEALEVVLKTYGYAYERSGNVIRVTTLESLSQEELDTEVFTLIHAKADEIQETLQEMLSERGSLRGDTRTNVLIVTDVPTNLYKISRIIKRIDMGIPQVLIETKIIEMTLSDAEQLGIRWNPVVDLRGPKRPTTFPWNANRDNDVFERVFPRGKPDTSTSSVSTDGLVQNVIETVNDFPSIQRGEAEGVRGTPASPFPFSTTSDFLFGTIDLNQFQVLLTAIEDRGNNKILSEPRITVLSNQEGKILVGEELYMPVFERNKDTGTMEVTGYEPRNIGVELTVKPKVNHDKQVSLELNPSISSLIGFEQLTAEVAVPRIAVREAKTNVRVNNTQTIVLGGLIKEDIVDNKRKVPLLGDLPLLEYIFSHTDKNVVKTDLMFFITVTVLEDENLA